MSAKLCPQCGRTYAETEKFCTEDGVTLRSTTGEDGLVNQVIADRYFVTKKLGEGGMGQVYLAEHVRMKRKCALKVMHPAMGQDPDAVSRFSREAANAAQIIHPNVAAVFDFGETPDRLIYLAMEFVEGESLSALIERYQALPAPRAASIAAQAADGLAAAHELGIVHRDLKPDNIMIAKNRDGSDCVKVVDFGIAKAMASGSSTQKVTRTGFVIGTPEYMSPEQLVGDPIDPRSDIYSLALVAFNMFTGTLPFPSRTSQEAMIMRLTSQPKTLVEMRGDVPWPPGLQAVMDRALARDPNERYDNAKDFGRALLESMRDMPNLTAEQLGTQLVAARAAAKAAGLGAQRATPTMVSVPGGALATAPAVAGSTRPMGAAASTATGDVPAPAPRGKLLPVAIGVGALVVAAGVGFAMLGGREAPAPVADTAAATVAAATPATGPAASVPAADSQPAAPIEAPAPLAAGGDAPVRTPVVAANTPARPQPQRPAATPPTTRPLASAPTPQTQPAAQPNPQPAYTPPVVTPPVTRPPVESAPVAPPFDRAAAARAVQQALQRFVDAFETRKIDEVRRHYPGMSTELATSWNGLLAEREVKDLKSTLVRVGTTEFEDPTTASTTLSMDLEFRAAGQKQTQRLNYAATLRREGSGWKIASLEAR